MSLNTLIPQPLPVYQSISDTYFCRKDCDYTNKTIVTSLRNLPSFILTRDTSLDNDFMFEQVDKGGNTITSFNVSQEPCIASVFTDEVLTDIIGFDFPESDIELKCGYFYIKITNGLNTWYTELIRFVDFQNVNSDYTKIEFRNDCNIQGVQIPFRLCPDFKFRFYLDELNGECCPTRSLEVETEQNQDLQEIEISKIYKKTYNLKTFLIPHFLVDAFYLMASISDNGEVNIFPKNENQNFYTGTCVKGISIEKIGEDAKCCFEQLNIAFQREDNLVINGCCGDINELECFVPTQSIIGLNESSGFLEDPGTLNIGDCFYISSASNPLMVQSNVQCISITEMNTHVGEVACWNGVCFSFSAPEQYTNSTQGSNTVVAELVGGVYIPMPNIIVNQQSAFGGILTSNIPDNYSGCLSVSDDNGLTFTDLGVFSSIELSNGVNVFLPGANTNVIYKLEAKNYNCTLGTTEKAHSF